MNEETKKNRANKHRVLKTLGILATITVISSALALTVHSNNQKNDAEKALAQTTKDYKRKLSDSETKVSDFQTKLADSNTKLADSNKQLKSSKDAIVAKDKEIDTLKK